MIVVRDLQSTQLITHSEIQKLVQQRIQELGGDAFDAKALGYFLVVEAGDTIKAIESKVGFNILRNRHTGIRFDEPGFTPFFEFIEEFPACYDMVVVLSDDGFGIELFVPIDIGADADLIAMCRMFAHAPENDSGP